MEFSLTDVLSAAASYPHSNVRPENICILKDGELVLMVTVVLVVGVCRYQSAL